MRLRKLEEKDVPLICEWMKDPKVNCFFRFDAGNVTQDTVRAFVRQAQDTDENLHLACVNDGDEYLGTISLKHIDRQDSTAEYAVSFRTAAQGTGAAAFATRSILHIAFEELGLEKVYLNVLADNARAIRFYEKMGFVREGLSRSAIVVKGERRDLCWYGILKGEYLGTSE